MTPIRNKYTYIRYIVLNWTILLFMFEAEARNRIEIEINDVCKRIINRKILFLNCAHWFVFYFRFVSLFTCVYVNLYLIGLYFRYSLVLIPLHFNYYCSLNTHVMANTDYVYNNASRKLYTHTFTHPCELTSMMLVWISISNSRWGFLFSCYTIHWNINAEYIP